MTAAGLGTLGSVTELRFAIDIAPLGDLSDPRTIVRLARAAEESGWDGVSIWDSLGLSMSSSAADLFVALAGIAAQTTRLKLITSIVALARRRPQLVVQAAATLDQLSNGRLVLGLGAGEDRPDFEAFGESHDRTDRIALMDESLAIVDAGLRGAELHHEGPRLRASSVVLGPRPAQQPRPPIWLGAFKPGGIRRAARWDGWIAVAMSEDGSRMEMTPADLRARAGLALDQRTNLGRAGEPFDIAVLGLMGEAGVAPSEWQAAGATWWLESLSPMRGSLEHLLSLVRDGPPR
jgi:alkanesulfonate monooxygenase SsuD/methylene tetrahydromethanopterin reductase-like flavin-dependent oxidoreductase (luciferase family)